MAEAIAEHSGAFGSVPLKMCGKCGLVKEVEKFYKRKGSKDGFRAYCKRCCAASQNAAQERNKARETVVVLESKTCPGCGIEKPGSGFSKSRRTKSGLQGHCKECNSKGQKDWGKRNRAREGIVSPDFKICPGCKVEKPASEFHKNKSNKDGLIDYCKGCELSHNRKRLYGASLGWQKSTLESQGGACAICKFIPGPGDKALHLDHKHGETPRGFLHNNCNLGIGHFKDSVSLIGKAIEYLNGPNLGTLYKKHLPKAVKDGILASQGYLCKICRTDFYNKRICFDHCHKTGMIRGALCRNCNCGLGYFNDSIEMLDRAIVYLNRFK
jgi:hypothetical protein